MLQCHLMSLLIHLGLMMLLLELCLSLRLKHLNVLQDRVLIGRAPIRSGQYLLWSIDNRLLLLWGLL